MTYRAVSLLAVISTIAVLLLAVSGVQGAQAATAPTVSPIGTFLPQYLHAQGDGTVTGSYCDTSDQTATYLKTFQADGTITDEETRTPNANGESDWFPANCDLTGMTAGTGGTTYVVLRRFTNGGATLNTELAAFKGKQRLWARTFTGCSQDGDGEIYYPTLGYDNTLYAFVTTSPQCTTPQPRLIALRADTGEDKLDTVGSKRSTPLEQPSAGQGVQYPHIFPTVDGVAFLDGTKTKFADGNGKVDTSKTHDLSTGNQQVIQAVGTATGQIYAQLVPDSTPSTANGQTCTGESEVVTQDSATNLRHLPIDDCTFKTNHMAATPDGGVVLIGGLGGSANAYDDRLVRYNGDGVEMYQAGGVDLNQLPGYSNLKTDFPLVDANGNVVIKAVGTQDSTQDQHVIVSKIDASGARSVLYTTATPTTDGNGAIDTFRSSAIDLTVGGVYLAVCGPFQYSPIACSNGDQMSLVLVHDPGIGFAYPKSAVVAPPVAAPNNCGDAAVIGARGSGINDSGSDFPGAQAIEVAKMLRTQYKMKLFDNDSNPADGAIGVNYPGVAIFSPDVIAYRKSVNQGRSNLLREILTTRNYCGPAFPIVLIGYSQGAEVVQSTLEILNREAMQGDGPWQSVAGTALFASPKFSPVDTTARGTYLADYSLSGVGGAAKVAPKFTGSTRTYCLAGDPVCLFSLSNLITGVDLHKTAYSLNDRGGPLLSDAAGLLAWQIEAGFGSGVAAHPSGVVTAYRVGDGSSIRRVSAATVNANGAPSIKFGWDFNSRGSADVTTLLPWVKHNYGIPRRNDTAQQVTTQVKISYADGSSTTQQVCINRLPTGAATC